MSMMNANAINFQRTYSLDSKYEIVKNRATQILGPYMGYEDLIVFNELSKSVTYWSEQLIPIRSSDRPKVMLLFSNPHPYSVYQGMFLSPNRNGRENLFWTTMKEADWVNFQDKKPNPKRLAEIFLNVIYQGPFELIFYCYYTFPTNFPEEIQEIFGVEFFNQVIQPEAEHELIKTIQETKVDAVLTFNKGIFNLASNDQIDKYIDRLIGGEVIHSQVIGVDRYIPIFLTYPTGWRYKKQYRDLRKVSLCAIRNAICVELNKSEIITASN
jgi:hypothetical protein